MRGDKRAGLLSALQEAAWPLYETQLTAVRAETLTRFKKALKAAMADGGEGFTSAASRCCVRRQDSKRGWVNEVDEHIMLASSSAQVSRDAARLTLDWQ